MALKVVSQKGFQKGVIAVMSRFSVPKGAVLKASNLLLSERGTLSTCDGTAIQSALGSAPSAGFLELGMLTDASFNVTKLALAAPTATTLRVYNWNTNPPTALTGGSPADLPLTSGWTQPQIVNFSNGATPTSGGLVVITLGNGQTPYTYDGTTFAQITANLTGAWKANHYYIIGDRIAPTGTNNAYQVVALSISSGGTGATFGGTIQQGGFSGASQPGFQSTDGAGATYNDNQLIWMCIKGGSKVFAQQSVPAGAAHAISHAGMLWLWNTSPTDTDPSGNNGGADGPSVLRASMLNDPNEWPNQNIAFVGKDDGQQGTGIATFTIAEAGIAPTGSLVLFKEYTTYQVNGVFGASNFQITQVKSDMGCIAGRSVQFATGFGIIRFSHLGFALFDGVNDKLISEEVRPYIFGRSDISGVDFTALTKARCALTTNPPMYCCALPTQDGNVTRIFCYDLVMKAWCIVDYFNASATHPITAMVQLRLPYQASQQEGPHTYIADISGGTASIREWQQGDTTWDATAVNYSVQLPEVGDPGSRAYFRRAQVRMHAPSAGSMTAAINIASSAQPNNSLSEAATGPSSGLAPNVLTTATYEGDSDLGVVFDIAQTGPSMNMVLSGSGKVTIEGADYHVVPKPPRTFGQAA